MFTTNRSFNSREEASSAPTLPGIDADRVGSDRGLEVVLAGELELPWLVLNGSVVSEFRAVDARGRCTHNDIVHNIEYFNAELERFIAKGMERLAQAIVKVEIAVIAKFVTLSSLPGVSGPETRLSLGRGRALQSRDISGRTGSNDAALTGRKRSDLHRIATRGEVRPIVTAISC